MPTPPRAGQHGVWSLRQARHLVPAVPERLLRSASRRGLVSPDGLDPADLLGLLLLDACTGLPARAPALADARDAEAMAAARAAWSAGDHPEAALIVTDAEARLAGDPERLNALLQAYHDRPRLVLPLGPWAQDLRARLAGGPA